MNKCKCGRDIPQRYNSTIQPKFCPKCALENIRKKGKTATKEDLQSIISGKTSIYTGGKKKSSKTRNNKALDLADIWFSRYIRVKYSKVVDGEIFCKDIITGKYYMAKHIDNGHHFSRYHNQTRYEENNCRPQNRSSNRFRGEADKKKFRENLIREIGEDEFNRISDLHNQSDIKFGDIELKEIAKKYRMLTKSLLNEKGVKGWW